MLSIFMKSSPSELEMAICWLLLLVFMLLTKTSKFLLTLSLSRFSLARSMASFSKVNVNRFYKVVNSVVRNALEAYCSCAVVKTTSKSILSKASNNSNPSLLGISMSRKTMSGLFLAIALTPDVTESAMATTETPSIRVM